MDVPSADLVSRWRERGDEQAAAELFGRYAGRLLALARSRLAAWLARHVDAEDVVQSAYKSFFTGARDGRYVLSRSGDLWRLLVAITLHKLQHQAEHYTAGKRRPPAGAVLTAAQAVEALAREPTPQEAAALADTLEQVFRGLGPLQRRVVELRLQGHSLDEIAGEVSRSERTVRRILEEVKQRLRQECPGFPGAGA